MEGSQERRSIGRQAIVVIHGIGEQSPMDTLRGFADAVLEPAPNGDGEPLYYSKPDVISDSFELRCLRTRDSRPRTDFYEFYWAHRMPNATWTRILEWLRLMLSRSRTEVPPRFRALWSVLVVTRTIFILAVLASLLAFLLPQGLRFDFPGTYKLPFGLAAIALLAEGLVLSVIGDAAIYLSPRPRNIEARHAIRSAGVALLERLHETGDYDRIVIVGHSLGSVIAYDILTYAWQRFHERHGSPASPRHDALDEAERLADALRKGAGPSGDATASWQAATRKLWREMQANGHAWRVSDFLSIGSPLAHASLLLARNAADFRRRVDQRELATCPPAADGKGDFSYTVSYDCAAGRRSSRILHHAGWPACVQWTNLYFPCRYLLFGDAVGGPVAPLFGRGVADIAVKTTVNRGWLTHTHYWTAGACAAEAAADSSILRLRQALDIRGSRFKCRTESN